MQGQSPGFRVPLGTKAEAASLGQNNVKDIPGVYPNLTKNQVCKYIIYTKL